MTRLIWLAALALTGCVTASSTMVGSDTAIISAKGLGWNESTADLMRKAISEAAKLGAQRGYAYFTIEGSQDTTRTGVAYLPGNVTSNTTGRASCYGYTCTGSATTNTTGYGPRAIPVVRPGADILIRFYPAGAQPEGAFSVATESARK